MCISSMHREDPSYDADGPVFIQDKFGEAEPLCRRAMAVAEVTMGNQHPEYSMCLNNLAQSLSELVSGEESCWSR